MTIITILLILLLALLTLLFVFKRQITVFMAIVLRVFFAVFLALALSALFLPQIYQSLSDTSLRQVGVYSTIRSFDSNITGVTNAPSNILDSIFNPGKATTETAPGPLESGLYPSLVSLFGGIYRIATLAGSITALIVIVYLSYATAGVVQSTRLEHRVRELEHKLALITQ